MPDVVNQSIEILASGGPGMATSSLGKKMDG